MNYKILLPFLFNCVFPLVHYLTENLTLHFSYNLSEIVFRIFTIAYLDAQKVTLESDMSEQMVKLGELIYEKDSYISISC